MGSELYPYVLAPKETTAIWGGESWKCWDANLVLNGALAGRSIADLRASQGTKLLGRFDPKRIFPVLTKTIDARDSLSVQVHPNDAYAQRVEHQPNGKTECWYVLSAKPDAQIVLGWTRETSRKEYEQRVADGTLGDVLRSVPAKAGDAFYLPAGTLHAIGPGIVLFETQQASDLTYRIFDWNRVGADGQPRRLDVAKAADVLNYRAGTAGALTPISYTFETLERTALVAGPNFSVERAIATSEPATLALRGRPLVMMPLDAPIALVCDDGEARVAQDEAAIVPAGARHCSVAASDGDPAAFMLVTPLHAKEEFSAELVAAGVEHARVDEFMRQF
ncbi:MAG: type I phosphomannose isomerase catalytic subunit [Candidatus Tyrphobacter sp.]